MDPTDLTDAESLKRWAEQAYTDEGSGEEADALVGEFEKRALIP